MRILRRNSGNILAFSLSILLGFLIVLLIFGLQYTRFLGAHLEQRTAIEAASLAAARDLSRIVIEDPYYGFVGLSDRAPTGKGTKAGDNWFMPVTGINTLFATVRLDMILSDYLNDPLMKVLAQDDYNRAITAKDTLLTALNSAITGSGTVSDADGNSFNLLNDAIAAYNSNSVRMTGRRSVLVPGSMKLALGYVDGLNTNTVIPQPSSVGQVPASAQNNGFYLANINVPYNGTPFVFAGVGDDVALVDHKTFKSTISGLAYSIPTIVKVEADQNYDATDEQGRPIVRTVHAMAAAEASSERDRRPAAGAFTVTFANGTIPELKAPYDLFDDGQIANSPCDSVQLAANGDYPGNPLTNFKLPELRIINQDHPTFGNAFSIAFYDWLRRGGTRLDVKAVIDAVNTAFQSTGGGAIHEFEMTPEGSISYSVVTAPGVNLPVSDKQWRATEGLGYVSMNSHIYDVQLTDYVYQPGRPNGGIHGGEPLGGKVVPGTPSIIKGGKPVQSIYENTTVPYYAFIPGPAAGDVRPTYTKTGTAVDITFRQRQ